MVHPAMRFRCPLWGTHLHGLKNAEAPAPVLVGHLSATLGLALRDLRLRHGIAPWHTPSIGQRGGDFNPLSSRMESKGLAIGK